MPIVPSPLLWWHVTSATMLYTVVIHSAHHAILWCARARARVCVCELGQFFLGRCHPQTLYGMVSFELFSVHMPINIRYRSVPISSFILPVIYSMSRGRLFQIIVYPIHTYIHMNARTWAHKHLCRLYPVAGKKGQRARERQADGCEKKRPLPKEGRKTNDSDSKKQESLAPTPTRAHGYWLDGWHIKPILLRNGQQINGSIYWWKHFEWIYYLFRLRTYNENHVSRIYVYAHSHTHAHTHTLFSGHEQIMYRENMCLSVAVGIYSAFTHFWVGR